MPGSTWHALTLTMNCIETLVSLGTCSLLMNCKLTRQDTLMRKAIEVRKKIALCLYFIASPDGYSSLANLFGVSRKFVSICIREVAEAIFKKLTSKYLTIAKGDKLLLIIR